jgi:hypothetical protein
MSVKKIADDDWAGVCKHGSDEVWEIHRATEHLAWRSLKAHRRGCVLYALQTELPVDDELHPMSVLGVWAMMIAEDYGHELPSPLTISSAAAYLDRQLHRIAHDEEQDFPLFRREIAKCRSHLEAVMSDSQSAERGAPCPTCKKAGQVVRLQREFPHWCEDPDCTQQFHFVTDEADVWVCPRNREHWWTAAGYAEYLDQRKGDTRAITTQCG